MNMTNLLQYSDIAISDVLKIAKELDENDSRALEILAISIKKEKFTYFKFFLFFTKLRRFNNFRSFSRKISIITKIC